EPVPAGTWSGTRDGTIEPPPCAQVDMKTLFTNEPSVVGDEDCLFLNVYTPRPYVSDLPVMVWIHGGGFSLGNIGDYDPSPLMTKDIVLVSMQYRLNTLGFLSTEDSVIPGNLGLKDQVLALRWVQENIRALGGNPAQVTIFGESAGGISVHYHMISPMSAGLFQRAIAQSGTALFPGLMNLHPRQTSIKLSQMLECPDITPESFTSQAFYDCLQDIPKEKLVMSAFGFVEFHNNPQVMFPSIDGDFLPQYPAKLLREGLYNKVDFMTGVTLHEGLIIVGPLMMNRATIDDMVANFSTAGPHVAYLEPDDESKVYLAKRIFYHYLQDLNITDENKHLAIKMFGDMAFNIPMDMSGKMHARDAAYGKNIFLYEFHHLGQYTLFDFLNMTFEGDWVSHGDDLLYLFNFPNILNVEKLVAKDEFMREIIVALWTNFARTGNPTPDMSLGFKWTPVSDPDDLQSLILNPSPYMRGYNRHDELEFWNNLPYNHNKRFFPEKFQ
ncbi:Cocaine esterase, partial [Halocaridina rubra]